MALFALALALTSTLVRFLGRLGRLDWSARAASTADIIILGLALSALRFLRIVVVIRGCNECEHEKQETVSARRMVKCEDVDSRSNRKNDLREGGLVAVLGGVSSLRPRRSLIPRLSRRYCS